MRIGEAIRSARIAKGMTQEQLGNILGVQKSAIAKYESGRVINIKRSTMLKLSEVLGLSASELIWEAEPEERNKDSVSNRLKIAMDLRNMKASEICERTGIPKSAMSYYISGKAEPKSDRINILARLLDVSEPWLLGYDVDMDRDKTQKEIDELLALQNRIKNDSDFRKLILKINKLKSDAVSVISNLADVLSEGQ